MGSSDKVVDAVLQQFGIIRADDLNDMFGSVLSDDDYGTVGGLLLAEFGRVPEFDEVVTLADRFEFRVIKADHRRIITLEMNDLED